MKWLGAALILSLSLYLGIALGAAERIRIRELEAFSRMMGAIGESVDLLRLPAAEIFCTYSDDVLEENGFLPRLRARVQRDGPTDALGQVISEMQAEGRLHCLTEDLEALTAFSKEFGCGDGGQEVRRCAYCAARLTACAKEASEHAQGNIRVSRALSFSAGILCVLMLM